MGRQVVRFALPNRSCMRKRSNTSYGEKVTDSSCAPNVDQRCADVTDQDDARATDDVAAEVGLR